MHGRAVENQLVGHRQIIARVDAHTVATTDRAAIDGRRPVTHLQAHGAATDLRVARGKLAPRTKLYANQVTADGAGLDSGAGACRIGADATYR